MMEMNNPKLPPKPNQAQQAPQMYKLPPKPGQQGQPGQYHVPQQNQRPSSSHNQNANKSHDDVRRSQSREKLQPQAPQTPQVGRPGSQNGGYLVKQPGSSRENLQQKTPNPPTKASQQRPSSAHRVQVQPSWWG
jgi:hypothetical protein